MNYLCQNPILAWTAIPENIEKEGFTAISIRITHTKNHLSLLPPHISKHPSGATAGFIIPPSTTMNLTIRQTLF